MKNKSLAVALAFFLGGIGAHKFYLEKSGQGLLYALFFWTFIPAFLGLIEAVSYIAMSQEQFDAKYNQGKVAKKLPSTIKEKPDGSTVAICPACAEEIKPEALKCKHCGTELASGSNNIESSEPAKSPVIAKVILAIFLLLMLAGVVSGMMSAFNAS
jgi:TM2 domain-containing membrane protein YozV